MRLTKNLTIIYTKRKNIYIEFRLYYKLFFIASSASDLSTGYNVSELPDPIDDKAPHGVLYYFFLYILQ